ncbi:MAG: ParB/RepB/Spo0J family partition protein [Anaerovoracaceae bacterium]|nr:ParB/RepB/Spo0J family partition protein [Anaerovoracaceae bacterium]
MAAAKKGGLGRGLDALFADVPVTAPEEEKKDEKGIADIPAEDRVNYIGIHEIMPNVNQPRKTFPEEKIEELADSIREHGIIQPIVVRKKQKGYEIVAGERRWRAAMKAGLSEVPCLLRELSDEQNMLIAIIENMQREDLNPIEEAEGLHQMISTFGLTQEEVSKSVGKSRPYITNSIRLLKLPDYIRLKVSEGELTAGHGRTLITVEDGNLQRQLCDKIIEEGLSVRQTEKLVSELGKAPKKKPLQKQKNPDTLRVEEELKTILGTKVSIVEKGKKGKIEIECFSRDELNRLIELLKKLG